MVGVAVEQRGDVKTMLCEASLYWVVEVGLLGVVHDGGWGRKIEEEA
jgi:hypothetical protein